jgi:hypothetical protein
MSQTPIRHCTENTKRAKDCTFDLGVGGAAISALMSGVIL